MYQSVFDGTQPLSSRLDITIDGARHGGGFATANAPTTTGAAANVLRIGGWQGGGFNWQGDIAEAIVFDRALTASEQHGVSQFLAQKYGLAGPTPDGPQLIGLDFNVNTISKTGDDPGGFAGQTGAWNSLNIGSGQSGAATGPLLTANGSATDNAVTFSFTSGTYLATAIAGDDLRGDVAFLQTGVQTGPLEWVIEGLLAGKLYDLAFFGQVAGGATANNAIFEVDGFGQILTDDVAIFNGVIANAGGQITGRLIHDSSGTFSSWSGLQIRGVFAAVPEPTSMLLLTAAAGLATLRRRRRHAL